MADINSDAKSKGGFIFGQNMEDRVKPKNSDGEDDKSEENGSSGEAEPEAASAPSPRLLRPSAFNPRPCMLAPGRLGSNPFVTRPGFVSPPSEGGMLSQARLGNPFAPRPAVHSVSTSSEAEGGASFNASRDTPSKFVLRPSALDKQTANFTQNLTSMTPDKTNGFKTSFRLEPAKISNPFNKDNSPDDKEEGDDNKQEVAASESEEGRKRLFGETSGGASKENARPQEAQISKEPTTNGTSGGSFIFGQGMERRVEASGAQDSGAEGSEFVFGEGQSDREVAAPNSPESGRSKSPVESTSPSQTLEESAALHQAKLAKREYHEEVEVKTGEEDESNVFQMNCKMFIFEKETENWIERGQGQLRLNDMSTKGDPSAFQSRLVMRTQGSLRVVMNTKIWPAMTVERASQKSVRFTAMDGDAVKVYLVMANPKDSDQIFSAIDWRVQKLKVQNQEEGEAGASQDTISQASTLSAGDKREVSRKDKRQVDSTSDVPPKKARFDREQKRDIPEDSNDSSTLDPETEASNESFSSTIRSSSSD